MMARFNRYSTGLDSVIPTIRRTSSDPLSVKLQTSMRGPAGVGGPRTRSRPSHSNLLRPTRPSALNLLMSSPPNMLRLGSMPRSRIFSVERKIGSLRPIRSNVTPFTLKPKDLLNPDIQQQNSVGTGLLRSHLSLAQHKPITNRASLTRNLLTSQNLQLSRTPTIFDIGRQMQGDKLRQKSVFNVR